MKKEIVVLGGGIIGLCSAYYLAEEGYHVTVVDKNDPLADLNCSTGNAGMIVPSHFVPLASPGIIGQGIRWIFNSRSPLYIRPQMNSELLSWLIKFWKSANAAHVQKSSPALKDYNSYSLDLYKKIASENKFDFMFKKQGLLLLCKTEKFLEEEVHGAQTANKLGLATRVLDKAGLKLLEPDIDMNVAGGVLYPGDAHLSPNMFVSAMYTYLQQKPNVRFFIQSEIKQVRIKNNTIEALLTGNGEEIQGDEFILAAGSWSAKFGKMLGLNIPILAGKGYSMTIQQQEQRLQTPSIFCEARVAITPIGNQIRFGGTMELGGEEYKINPLRLEGIINSINNYFPNYNTAPLQQVVPWSGLRPCSPDGLPYLGRTKKAHNLVAATGHAMMGLSLAPATGQIVSDIVAGRKPQVDIDLYSPDRYN